MENFGKRLKAARKSKRLTQEDVADHFGIKRENVSQWESETTKPDGAKLGPLADLYGVDLDWLLHNKGTMVKKPLIDSFDDSVTPQDELDPDWDGNGAGYLDGQIHFQGSIPGSTPEFSARPGMGYGQSDDRTARLVTGGIASGHPVLNEWLIPPEYVRNALDASPSQVAILGVIGHSMQPMLNPNDRVMVDFSQNTWVGDAVYVIDELDGVMQAKTLRRVSVRPPVYEVVSEADPSNPRIRKHDEIRIVGRVVGRFTRM